MGGKDCGCAGSKVVAVVGAGVAQRSEGSRLTPLASRVRGGVAASGPKASAPVSVLGKARPGGARLVEHGRKSASSGGVRYLGAGGALGVGPSPGPVARACEDTIFDGELITRAVANAIARAEGDRLLDYGKVPSEYEDGCPSRFEVPPLGGGPHGFGRGDIVACADGFIWLLVSEGDDDRSYFYLLTDEIPSPIEPLAPASCTEYGGYCVVVKIEVRWMSVEKTPDSGIASRHADSVSMVVELRLVLWSWKRSDTELVKRFTINDTLGWIGDEGSCFTGWYHDENVDESWSIRSEEGGGTSSGSGTGTDFESVVMPLTHFVEVFLDARRHLLRRHSCDAAIIASDVNLSLGLYLLSGSKFLDRVSDELEPWAEDFIEACEGDV